MYSATGTFVFLLRSLSFSFWSSVIYTVVDIFFRDIFFGPRAMTLRAHIYIVNTCIFLSILACSTRPPADARKSALSKEGAQALDTQGRGKPDTWRWYKAGQEKATAGALVREDVDLNGDGKVDLSKRFQGEHVLQMEFDLDFDGRFDLTRYFDQGKLVRSESSHNFLGKTDTWQVFEDTHLVRTERDTNGDGKPDRWIYFKNGVLARTGVDSDFDGVVDTWE
jgi:hypothetical protein